MIRSGETVDAVEHRHKEPYFIKFSSTASLPFKFYLTLKNVSYVDQRKPKTVCGIDTGRDLSTPQGVHPQSVMARPHQVRTLRTVSVFFPMSTCKMSVI